MSHGSIESAREVEAQASPRADSRLRRVAPAAAVGVGLVAPVACASALMAPGDPQVWHCTLLEATGVPCPACGATRAFVYLTHGDPHFTQFNWVWLVVWLIAFAGTLLVAARRWRGRPAFGPRLTRLGHALRHRPALVVALPFLLLAPAWAIALANVEWIR